MHDMYGVTLVYGNLTTYETKFKPQGTVPSPSNYLADGKQVLIKENKLKLIN